MEDEGLDDHRPVVACLRCRNQKLKCGREVPACLRCSKQRVNCSYPSPPDRKRIAAHKSRRPNERTSDNSEVVIQHEDSVEPALPQKPGKRRRTVDDFSEQRDEGIELSSTEIGLLLLEVYFKRIYNSTLIFHKDHVFQQYTQDLLPAYLCRAIFAQAAVFTEPADLPYDQRVKVLPLPFLFERSWYWARSASQKVLSCADEPKLQKIQALQETV